MNDINLYGEIEELEKLDTPYTKKIARELFKLYESLYIEINKNFDLIQENQDKIYKFILNNHTFNEALNKIKFNK